MQPTYLPSSLRSILFTFRPCFTAPSFGNFVALVLGFVLAPGRRWISRAIGAPRLLGPRKHHSTFYRFFSRARWEPDVVGRCLFGLVAGLLPREIDLLVDDTLCRRAGPRIFGVGAHVDLINSRYQRRGRAGSFMAFALGVDWVVLAVWIPLPWNPQRGLALPLLARLYRTRKTCPKARYRKRTELAREMIEIFATWLPAGYTAHLVTDREYACGPVLKDLPGGVHFTGPMDPKAALFSRPMPRPGRGRPRTKGRRLASPQQRFKGRGWRRHQVRLYGAEVPLLLKTFVCLWPTVLRTRAVRVYLTHDPRGRYQDRAYFSTALDQPAEEALARIARRWELEVAFRNGKQSFGWTDPQNGWSRGRRPRRCAQAASSRTFPFLLMAYSITVAWYLRHGRPAEDVTRARKARPWHRHKREPSFDDMLGSLKREIWRHQLFRGHLARQTRRKILALLPILDSAA